MASVFFQFNGGWLFVASARYVMPLIPLEAMNMDVLHLFAMEQMILMHIVSVVTMRHDGSVWHVLTGGTGCLVETKQNRFIVTAAHVVSQEQPCDAIRCIGGHSVKFKNINEWQIIDSSSQLDLATIQIPEDFDPAEIAKTSYLANSWPPDRARAEELAIFTGFPGIHRQTTPGAVFQATGLFYDKVASSSSRHFVIAHENTRSVYKFDEALADFGSTGGVSGAPVFIERKNRLELCGHIYEGGDTSEATFFAAHSDFIDEAGYIIMDRGIPILGSLK